MGWPTDYTLCKATILCSVIGYITKRLYDLQDIEERHAERAVKYTERPLGKAKERT